MNCIVGFLVNLSIRIIVLAGKDTGWWAQFNLDQVRIFIDVLAIYYTVVAILMCT